MQKLINIGKSPENFLTILSSLVFILNTIRIDNG